ncbi:MAG: (Fe-S)-binding protein [Deltaproteobacteria bacterium]|nr:(Fe-S)-binding protein [Deltaproteobacteria bacterium]
MNPIAMTVILVASIAALAYSLNRRWLLLKVGRPTERLDNIPKRVWTTILYAFGQRRMPYYPLAGVAHILIFFGFMVLLLRSLILWGRAFSPSFHLWILGPEPVLGLPLGHLYDLAKDSFAVLVVIGACVFIYLRIVTKEKRMTLHWEGLLILGIIVTMMLSDMLYDGAALALAGGWKAMACGPVDANFTGTCADVFKVVAPFDPEHAQAGQFLWFAPMGSIVASALAGVAPSTLRVLAHAGFWIHGTLVLVFANLLPYTKHFHIFTSIPNVFTSDIGPAGRLPTLAASSEKLMETVGAAAELEDPNQAPIGVARAEHLTWKSILDFYTCTECGRCTDNCPANRTGKLLSPKQFTLDLRDHMYGRDQEFIDGIGGPLHPVDASHGGGHGSAGDHDKGHGHDDKEHGHDDKDHGHDKDHGGHHEPVYPDNPHPNPPIEFKPVDLVSGVIQPDVLWACTTCRACEEFCPVMISYVDKIVDMRRNLVLVRGEFPPELQKPFQAMETNGNPWNLSRMDRAAWAEGLDVPRMADKPKAEVLYWVGCAASYDDRAKKIARAMVRLLKAAGVDFAILGEEEQCNGDPARRAGNEFLFLTLAEANITTINGYKEQGGVRKILTTCPHCFNTLKNEYPEFGGSYDVIHHAEFLEGLVRDGKLKPKHPVKGRVVYHDACYLGRYNGTYEPPRQVLEAIPGTDLVEVEHFNRNMGLCCGAGGGQMWMEEQNKDRMNVRRTLQLLDTKADTIATSCPFCMTMITDGLKDQSKEDDVRQLDIAELLEEACFGRRGGSTVPKPEDKEQAKEPEAVPVS